jgi:CHAD domain-containing protein
MGASPNGGSYAADLLEGQLKAIVGLQSGVLKDQDPEPLHQLRVRFRRLRTLLLQFGPAVVLPERVNDQQLAKTGRRLGLVRDLDVLLGQVEKQCLPPLPSQEQLVLKPLLKSLRRSRKLAFAELEEELRSRRYLRLLALLQGWLRQPVLTAMGEEPALDWLVEWKSPVLAGLLSHPGWRAGDADGDGPSLHDLRKRIKQARYGLTNLMALETQPLTPWLERFKSMQDTLGELNDLQVLERAFADQLNGELAMELPEFSQRVQLQKRQLFQCWQEQAHSMVAAPGRSALQGLLCPGWPGCRQGQEP